MKFATSTFLIIVFWACTSQPSQNENLMKQIQTNEYFGFVKEKALEVVKTGINEGDGYGEVRISDNNTIIEI